jgi:hypothetical protein
MRRATAYDGQMMPLVGRSGRRQKLLCDVDKKHIEIPEVINRATRRAAASMKRNQKENKNVTVRR